MVVKLDLLNVYEYIIIPVFLSFSVPKSALSRISLCLMVRRALCLGVLRMSYKATEVFRTLRKSESLVTSNLKGYNCIHTKDNEWLDTQRWGFMMFTGTDIIT